jgi:tetraprenyl-beta-curcumene synthase
VPAKAADRLALAVIFVSTAKRYWFDVFPRVRRAQRQWWDQASAIPNPALRRAALGAQQRKRGNHEGAAAFATLAPVLQRAPLVQALVAFQTMYDYLDTISERPGASSPANARQLHRALHTALDRSVPEPDYYALDPARHDGGYLRSLVAECRGACESLPAYPIVAANAARFADFIVAYQGVIGAQSTPAHPDASWAPAPAPAHPELRWWEIAAAAGSSLPVLALLAAAADPTTHARDVAAIEAAYFPWIAALHTLLDSLVDQEEDALGDHHSLVSHYASYHEAAVRLGELTRRSIQLAHGLPQGKFHVTILSGMASYYLADPEASRPQAREARRAVLAALDGPTGPALLIFRLRRLADFALGWRRRFSTAKAPDHSGELQR